MRLILHVTMLVTMAASAAWAADAKAGHGVFDRACKSCHGPDGTPNASVAKMMKVEMRELKSAEVQALTNDEMKNIITGGKGKMMAVKNVSGPAVEDVIAHIRTFKK